MEVLSKVKIPTAVNGRRNMVLDSTHITSTRWMVLRPVYYRHPVPTEIGHVEGVFKSQLSPVAQPLFGKARVNLRAFWVPYRLLCPDWDNLITDTPRYSVNADDTQIPQNAPYFSTNTIGAFLSSIGAYSEVVDADSISAGAFDFVDAGSYYKFNSNGRHYLTVLESLGYRWSYSIKNVHSIVYNAFGLLALLRVYLDWYANGQYLDSQAIARGESLLNRCHAGYELNPNDLFYLLNMLYYVGYDSNSYFVSAWDNPVAPNSRTFSAVSIPDVTTVGLGDSVSDDSSAFVDSGVLTYSGTPHINYDNVLTQYGIDSLHALTDFFKRNQLSGRAIDRYLSRFGVQLKGESIKRSVYCGSKSIDIDFGLVVSTGDSDSLGDKAGIGTSGGSFSFDYDSNGEYGVFLILQSVLPDGDLVDGYDRMNRCLSRYEFFQPEFDGLGTMAAEKGEVCVFNNSSKVSQGGSYDQVFGFAPSYAYYKVGRSQFTGDLRFPGTVLGGSSWHLFRDVQYAFQDTDELVHSLLFTIGQDSSQYNRIFNDTFAEVDPFICVFGFRNTISSPAKSLFDTYDFKQDGEKVTLDSNGVKVN